MSNTFLILRLLTNNILATYLRRIFKGAQILLLQNYAMITVTRYQENGYCSSMLPAELTLRGT